jgi:hypothetical protein
MGFFILRNVHFSNSTHEKLHTLANMNGTISNDLSELASTDSVNLTLTSTDVLSLSSEGSTHESTLSILKINQQIEQQQQQQPQISKGISKTRKIGQIFKLASVRGAKVVVIKIQKLNKQIIINLII